MCLQKGGAHRNPVATQGLLQALQGGAEVASTLWEPFAVL